MALPYLLQACRLCSTTVVRPTSTFLSTPSPFKFIALSQAKVRTMATQSHADSGKVNFPTDASLPGEEFEPRQIHPTGDYTPDPSKSLPTSPQRQALLDDIVALYECKPTIERVKRYTPDCVYDDQFVYANDRQYGFFFPRSSSEYPEYHCLVTLMPSSARPLFTACYYTVRG